MAFREEKTKEVYRREVGVFSFKSQVIHPTMRHTPKALVCMNI